MADHPKHTHPVFDDLAHGDSHYKLLRSTHAGTPGFSDPVLQQPVADELEKPADHKVLHPKRRLQPVTGQLLSPFAQWLLTLKPTHLAGETALPMAPPEVHSVESGTEKAVEAKKKRKKKKKKGVDKVSGPPETQLEVVTDTLAELVASQGHIEEAIAMYRKLVNLHPEKAAFYIQRIGDLKQG